MRKFLPALMVAPLLAIMIAAAPPAAANVAVLSDLAAKFTAPYAKASTDAVVELKMTQTSYADISLNIAFSGFHAHHEVTYGKGACPTSVARVILPAGVSLSECGWEQEGEDATLRLALKGTFEKGRVKVRVKSGALTAPKVAGVYGIFATSWAFDDVFTTTEIASGPLK